MSPNRTPREHQNEPLHRREGQHLQSRLPVPAFGVPPRRRRIRGGVDLARPGRQQRRHLRAALRRLGDSGRARVPRKQQHQRLPGRGAGHWPVGRQLRGPVDRPERSRWQQLRHLHAALLGAGRRARRSAAREYHHQQPPGAAHGRGLRRRLRHGVGLVQPGRQRLGDLRAALRQRRQRGRCRVPGELHDLGRAVRARGRRARRRTLRRGLARQRPRWQQLRCLCATLQRRWHRRRRSVPRQHHHFRRAVRARGGDARERRLRRGVALRRPGRQQRRSVRAALCRRRLRARRRVPRQRIDRRRPVPARRRGARRWRLRRHLAQRQLRRLRLGLLPGRLRTRIRRHRGRARRPGQGQHAHAVADLSIRAGHC